MKKKELLALPKLTLSQMLVYQARKNEKYSRFYRAAVYGDVLKVSVWSRRRVLLNATAPDYEIYVDKKNESWMNYNPAENSWGKARIENLNMPYSQGDYYGVKGYETPKDRKLVNEYFDGDEAKNRTIRDVVLKFQKNIARENLVRAHTAELALIDAVMYQVPDEPKDFEEWIVKDAFSRSQYMIYDRAAGKARCTACWGTIDAIKDFRHNKTGCCPICHEAVTYKSWNKQKSLVDRKIVGILQRLRDDTGYILRQWKVCIRYRRDTDYTKELSRYEYLRYEMSDRFICTTKYEYGEYKNTGQNRWCYDIRHGMNIWYADLNLRPECILYTRNITKLLKNTELKYMPMTKMLRRLRGRYIEVDKVFGRCIQNPQIEVMVKVGLLNAAYDMLGKYSQQKKWTGESPWKYLGVTKEYYETARKKDASLEELKIMELATEHNMALNYDAIQFYAKYMRGSNARTIFGLGHPEKMYRYLQELKASSERELQDYMDYIQDIEYLHLPKTKATLFPKDFAVAHRGTAELRLAKEKEIESLEIRKKNRLFKKILPEIKKLYEQEDERFCIVVPECKKDFQIEGQIQHNCVGGTYFDKMLKGNCVVVFLREKKNPGQPYCTVEFSPDGNVIQNRAIYNRQAPPEAVEFIATVTAKVKKAIKKAEIEKIREAEAKEKAMAAV